MSQVRSRGQSFIGAWFDEEFLKKVDEARGPVSRSQFLRDAMRQKLTDMGYAVSSHETLAPDRTGKGGPTKYPPIESQAYALNDAPGPVPKGQDVNPAVAKDHFNLMPDPNLSPKVKEAADKLEALARKHGPGGMAKVLKFLKEKTKT